MGSVNIKNHYNDPVFKVEDDVTEVAFSYYEIEGCDPYCDYVLKPLNELCNLARETGVELEGDIIITSSSHRDYYNILIHIKNNNLCTGDAAIENATTSELMEELRRRGVKMLILNEKREEHHMLALSTGHLTCETAKLLDSKLDGVPSYYNKGEHGWFFSVPDDSHGEEKTEWPEDLRECIRFAHDEGYQWIMFDNDVEPIDELPTYEW